MKKLLLTVLMALSLNAGAQTATALLTPSPVGVVITAYSFFNSDKKKVHYIKVETEAPSFEQAKQQAFRLASEQVAGTVVLSESELRGRNLSRDEIVTYSSGVVDEYKIVSRIDSPGSVRLVTEIWIAESVIAQRLLSKSVSEHNINGDALGTRADSIIEERRRADQLFLTVLRDIPLRSFQVKTTAPQIRMDGYRNTWATVDWELSWDPRFLAAFTEVAKETGRKPCWWRCPNIPVYYIQGFEFDDMQKLLMIVKFIESLDLYVMLEVLDVTGAAVARTCERIEQTQSLL